MTEEIIARLRSLDLSDGGSHSRLSAIASCFYQPTFGWTRGACETLRDMLIDTLEDKDGNDNNDNSDGCNCTHHRCDQHGRQVSYDELGNERHKAVCELRKLCERNVHIWKAQINMALGLGLDASNEDLCDRLIHLLGGDELDLQKSPIFEDSGTDDAGEVTITDELRKFKGLINTGLTPEMAIALRVEINRIADRIDEQFDRICEQQEKVLQDIIDYMTELREHDAEYALAERDVLQEKCDRLKAKVEHQREQLAVYATTYDFDAIRALKRERNEHKHRADNAEGHVKSLERRLDAAHETYCALLNDAAREFRALTEDRDELQAKLDDYDKTHVELPKDENDEYIHIGDMMDGYAKTIEVVELRYGRSGWMLISRDGNGYADTFAFEHHHDPTIKQVIRDLTLGKITESQAIKRIEGING